MKILITGLPGAGKTTFAIELQKHLGKSTTRLNADEVRARFNDWDFSLEGRERQARRMLELSDNSKTDYVICDFVAPTNQIRELFNADYVIWLDTILEGSFEDTNKIFEEPTHYDFRITKQDGVTLAPIVAQRILAGYKPPVFDWKKPTVQMLGRWQPFHAGHLALFERLLEKTGQVCIMVRDCQGWNHSNPFAVSEVISNIKKVLDFDYKGTYEIVVVPNIVHIGYGRDVGYTIAQETFTDEIHSISATKIRKEMGIE